jgi:hypothetical protein
MKQQTLERPILTVMESPTEEKPEDVLTRLWEEADRSVEARRPPAPAHHWKAPEEKRARIVRFNKD